MKLNNFDDVIGNRKPSLESFERGLHVKNTILDLKKIICSRWDKIGNK